MIALVDYGAGNLVSVRKAIEWLGFACDIVSDPDQVRRATKMILPGVGHFAATESMARSGVRQALIEATHRGTLFLGICVGMQWMFEGSEEAPHTPGSGWFSGTCERFPAIVKSPHVGWNSLHVDASSILFRDIPESSFVYFTHSYRVPVNPASVACSDYGGKFSAAVERDNLFGVQFHPEKSGEIGLKILERFCAL